MYVYGHYPSSCHYLKHRPVYIFKKQDVSETAFRLRNVVLKYVQDDIVDNDRTMDNVQKHNICTNVPSSQTFRSYQDKYFTDKKNICYNNIDNSFLHAVISKCKYKERENR
jgi:hypothetical protein